jgi:hypothetical protein
MGTFAKIVIVDYCSSFADPGKQRPFPFLFAAKTMKLAVFRFTMETMETSNVKRKRPGNFP